MVYCFMIYGDWFIDLSLYWLSIDSSQKKASYVANNPVIPKDEKFHAEDFGAASVAVREEPGGVLLEE